MHVDMDACTARVPYHMVLPCVCVCDRYFKKDALHLTHKFVPPMCFLPAQPLGSIELEGNRRTSLGLNM